jgi:hypothetical protein
MEGEGKMSPTLQFWINVGALLISPLIAVQVTERVRKLGARRERQLWIFRTLMLTRGDITRGAPPRMEHVQALNLIELDFEGKRAVLHAWKDYLSHLSTPGNDNPAHWVVVRDDRLRKLLQEMARALRYGATPSIDHSASYLPVAHADAAGVQARTSKALLEVLEGRQVILIAPQDRPSQAPQPSPDNPTKPT